MSAQYKITFIDGKSALCPQPAPITDPVGMFLHKFTQYRVKEISEKDRAQLRALGYISP